MIKKLAILSPAFPPEINGLGDYAIKLGATFEIQGISIFYIGLDQNIQPLLSNYFCISTAKNSLLNILKKNNCTNLLINYSGYGYQRKGLPFWLLNSIRAANKDGIRLFVVFHELYASTKTYTSLLFFTSSIQKMIYQSIARLSSHIFCTNERMLFLVKKELPKLEATIHYTPLFSNITIPNQYINLSQRKKQAVIFGTIGRRKKVYEKIELINIILLNIGIIEIIDIGDLFESNYQITSSIPIKHIGRVSNEDVAGYLLESQIGIIDYRSDLLGKSGIFAAYAGNGLAIINTNSDYYPPYDNIYEDEVFCKLVNTKENVLITLSKNAFNWYQTRTVEQTSSTIMHNLNE